MGTCQHDEKMMPKWPKDYDLMGKTGWWMLVLSAYPSAK
jgi:hypothetical protein